MTKSINAFVDYFMQNVITVLENVCKRVIEIKETFSKLHIPTYASNSV